ncbi:lactadherin-like [Amphiura filiformis]|uniref:lactadherin-like n=1 Tax=Amphiura filiformis TaxID=82378 RepID=UPI003B20FE28
MESGEIRDGAIEASDSFLLFPAANARLNGDGAWAAHDFYGIPPFTDPTTQWIQANIGYETNVSAVITQGDGGAGILADGWVRSFKVSTFLSADGNEMFVMNQTDGTAMIFPGNTDINTKVTTNFPEPVYARIVRITCLSGINGQYALRFELVGCKI